MKMLKLTRAYEFKGGKDAWVNFDLVEMVLDMNEAHEVAKSRVCFSGDAYLDVTETCDEIAKMANTFAYN